MAGTQGTQTRTLADLNESEKALVEFKTLLNQKMPEIFPYMKSWGKLLSDDPASSFSTDPMDSAFLDVLDRSIFNTSLRSTNTEIKALYEAYKALPEEAVEPITLKRQMFDAPSVEFSAHKQAASVVNLGQQYLGVDTTESGIVDQETGKALSIKLATLQSQNPDIQTNVIPQYYDQRSVDFLNALVEKRMEDVGVTRQTDLDTLLVNTWDQKQDGDYIPNRAMANLAEIISLRNIVELIVNAQLPNGQEGVRVQVDAPWNTGWDTQTAPDRFFSEATYDSLGKTKEVSGQALFGNYSTNPNADLLREFAQNIGMDTNKATYTEVEVGMIAAEMLAHQARELCIPEHEVNTAIHDGRFMPHYKDLEMVERGYGYPPGELADAALLKTGLEQWHMDHYGPIRDAVIEYRNVEFVNRFGGIPDEQILDMQRRRSGADTQLDREQGLRDFGSAARYFASYKTVTGNADKQTLYDFRRDNEYLPYLSERAAAGTIGGMCRVVTPSADIEGDIPKASDEGCTVESVIEDNGAPCEGDDCTVEKELERRIKSGQIKPCDDFSDGAGADASASDAIQSNMSDATGQSSDACTVEAEIARRLEGGELTRPCDTNNDIKIK